MNAKHAQTRSPPFGCLYCPMSNEKNATTMRKKIFRVLVVLVVLGAMMASCNVTRTITNESQYYQRGDTSVVIQTKTVETYDASKR